MRLNIEHITTFTYDHPISEAYSEMRLRPLDGNGQICLSFDLHTEPQGDIFRYRDRFGNDVRNFDFIQPHQQLVVAAHSEVMTPEQYIQQARSLSPLDKHDFLMETGYAPFNEDIFRFAATCEVENDSKATAMAIMHAIYTTLQYEKGATDVTTTADQALILGRGVCQDFSHLMLATCRSQNIPARYVSGYLFHDGDTNASHAWVDIFVSGQGWYSLDPTHDREQNSEYVRVGIGRDYSDVPPTRGVFLGNAKEQMDVSVAVKMI